jgi:nitrate/TMAO reductase-like tetraheme cytochrome c subunit
MIANFWNFFWRPSRQYAFGAILIAGGIGGVIFWGGFNTFMEYTNTLEFCISCHEMNDNVYVEYKETIHYRNPSGVRTICSDCHVPKNWTAKLWRKIKASKEVYHSLIGTIDTPEKFNAHRLVMAERVWAEMKANNSQECRNCHSYDAMHWEKQRRRSAEKMQEGVKQGKTCIECHQGVAHKRPVSEDDDD